MVEIVDGTDNGSNTVSAVVLLAHGEEPIRIGIRGGRPAEITYAGRTWTATGQMTETGGGGLAYCYTATPHHQQR